MLGGMLFITVCLLIYLVSTSEKRVINKIVIVEVKKQPIKYWVQVKTIFFVLLDVAWRKLDT